jgi:hypothetical protein
MPVPSPTHPSDYWLGTSVGRTVLEQGFEVPHGCLQVVHGATERQPKVSWLTERGARDGGDTGPVEEGCCGWCVVGDGVAGQAPP